MSRYLRTEVNQQNKYCQTPVAINSANARYGKEDTYSNRIDGYDACYSLNPYCHEGSDKQWFILDGGAISCRAFQVWEGIFTNLVAMGAINHHLQHIQGTIHTKYIPRQSKLPPQLSKVYLGYHLKFISGLVYLKYISGISLVCLRFISNMSQVHLRNISGIQGVPKRIRMFFFWISR